jgi:Family of unknown function (DUF6527)
MSWLIDWWRRRHFSSDARIDEVEFVSARGDVPESIPRRQLVVVGSEELPKWAIFECPCGRGHRLEVNLSPQVRPFWRITFNTHGPSLKPSVDSVGSYRCHFWLRDGRVHWPNPRQRGSASRRAESVR